MIDVALCLSVLLTLHYLAFIFYIIQGIRKLLPASGQASDAPSVSVIIPFRNESSSLPRNLECMLNQNYPPGKAEFIYADDNSDDDSAEIIKASVNGIIKYVSLTSTNGKKAAIAEGIGQANGDIIVTADADCSYGKNWLSSLINYFDDDTGFVAGPVRYAEDSHLFPRMQIMEFAGLVLTGAGFIGNGNPVICNGANAAYRKELYYKVKGFLSADNLASGDDELIMRKIHTSTDYKVKFCTDGNATAFTRANSSLKGFFAQRQRWASKSMYYKKSLIAGVLLPVFLFYALLPVLAVYSLSVLNLKIFFFAAAAYMIKGIAEFKVLQCGNDVCNLKLSFGVSLLTSILHPVYVVISSAAGVFFPYRWKGRKVIK